MRFKKGSEVEVYRKSDGSVGSWWWAVIVSGNGHFYNVMYNRTPDGVLTEKVPRKALRPLPPGKMKGGVMRYVGTSDEWKLGDFVEFFDKYCWKVAELVEVVEERFFLLKPYGSTEELVVHMNHLRARMSWKNDEWTLIGKDSHRSNDREFEMLSLEKNNQINGVEPFLAEKEGTLRAVNPTKENIHQDERREIELHKSNKRGREQPLMPYVSTNMKPHKRVKAMDQGGSYQPSDWRDLSKWHEKVDAVAFPQKLLGKQYMHDSFKNRTTGSQMNAGNNFNFFANVVCVKTSESSDSVGSCCGSKDGYCGLLYTSREVPRQDSCSDDAESSSNGWDYKKVSAISEIEVAEKVHDLELLAYRSTLEALFASGPLSWDQEEMMTNLRLSLNISNDEHLMELKNLVSRS